MSGVCSSTRCESALTSISVLNDARLVKGLVSWHKRKAVGASGGGKAGPANEIARVFRVPQHSNVGLSGPGYNAHEVSGNADAASGTERRKENVVLIISSTNMAQLCRSRIVLW